MLAEAVLRQVVEVEEAVLGPTAQAPVVFRMEAVTAVGAGRMLSGRKAVWIVVHLSMFAQVLPIPPFAVTRQWNPKSAYESSERLTATVRNTSRDRLKIAKYLLGHHRRRHRRHPV